MQECLTYIILGFVQGITEWLPVSSSGHLVILEYFFGIRDNVTYNIFLHFASLLVIFIIFRKRILEVIKTPKYWPYIIIGSIPAGLLGFYLYPYFQTICNNMLVVAFSLLITAGLLLNSGHKFKRKKMNYRRSLKIGLFQALAILPGVSRSGSTIVGARFLGIPKKEAIEFSFLLAIPAIIGASLVEFSNFSAQIHMAMIVGSFVNIVVSYFSIKLLIKFVQENKLKYFGYYCLALGIVLLVYVFYPTTKMFLYSWF